MAKWKCEICRSEFENFQAQGFDNRIHCPLCYFKRKSVDLENKLSQSQKALNEIREYLKTWEVSECDKNTVRELSFESSKEDILEIIDKVLGGNNE